ncbi:hypothetical protein CPB85DRAFT_1427905 [Mucidula mucida]|nr:hypothetical protein CPB85DRAFT_1427905 [Mucidula mucida]
MAEFERKDPLSKGTQLAVQGAAVGIMVSALRNALGSHTQGAAGVLTRTGGTIGLFAAVGFTFAYAEAFVANQRETDDAWNGATGACAAAFLGGLRAKSLPVAATGCAVMGAIVGEDIMERRKKFFKHPPDFGVDSRARSE